MLHSVEPTEFRISEPPIYRSPMPEWAPKILDYVAPRQLVEVNNITKACFSSGNRTGRKKLMQLTKGGYLTRYEISTSERHFIAYSLGLEGMRYTRRIAPEVDMIKAQELIIANHFCAINQIPKFSFNVNSGMLIGKVDIGGQNYSLWCPRIPEKPKRVKSLQNELPLSSQGLVVIAPNLRYIYSITQNMYGFYVPVYFCIDTILNRFMRLDNDVLVPI